MIQITPISTFPISGFRDLLNESQMEKFNFLRRLEENWKSGKNQFSKQGEGLYAVYSEEELVAIGGINIDPYSANSSTGRLRKFYVKKSWRRKGIGKLLVEFILQNHQAFFREITLFTDHEAAGKFYEKCGFRRIEGVEKVSHSKFF